jgi:hypothetical protein
MLMTEIKRSALALPTAHTDEVLSLAADAEVILGYSLLRNSLDAPADTPRLAQVLAELGIEVLNKADVLDYMRERLCDRTLELLDEWQKSNPAALGSWGYGANFSGPSWEATPIDKYREAIPEFVVNKAVQIKRALPEAEIFIRHLTEDKDPFLEVTLGKATDYDADRNGSERYFVEVWEEPKFEGRLR